MAKQKKTKKGDPKKISELESAIDKSMSKGADKDAYKSAPPQTDSSTTSPADSSTQTTSVPRKKYVKETLFPRKVMALFTEEQYQELNELKSKLMKRDGAPHTLNSVIREAVARIVNDFRSGR